MSIHSLRDWKALKEQGKRLGRQGLSERVFTLVDEFNKEENRSYKNAMVLAGRLKAIAHAATFDSYWDEKASIGYENEKYDLKACVFPSCKLPKEDGTVGADSWWIK
jgi:hypothetical protein